MAMICVSLVTGEVETAGGSAAASLRRSFIMMVTGDVFNGVAEVAALMAAPSGQTQKLRAQIARLLH